MLARQMQRGAWSGLGSKGPSEIVARSDRTGFCEPAQAVVDLRQNRSAQAEHDPLQGHVRLKSGAVQSRGKLTLEAEVAVQRPNQPTQKTNSGRHRELTYAGWRERRGISPTLAKLGDNRDRVLLESKMHTCSKLQPRKLYTLSGQGRGLLLEPGNKTGYKLAAEPRCPLRSIPRWVPPKRKTLNPAPAIHMRAKLRCVRGIITGMYRKRTSMKRKCKSRKRSMAAKLST